MMTKSADLRREYLRVRRMQAEIFLKVASTLCVITNACAVVFICWAVYRHLYVIEKKLDVLRWMVAADFSRHAYVFVKLLEKLKAELWEQERFEEAMEIQKLINIELENQKKHERN